MLRKFRLPSLKISLALTEQIRAWATDEEQSTQEIPLSYKRAWGM